MPLLVMQDPSYQCVLTAVLGGFEYFQTWSIQNKKYHDKYTPSRTSGTPKPCYERQKAFFDSSLQTLIFSILLIADSWNLMHWCLCTTIGGQRLMAKKRLSFPHATTPNSVNLNIFSVFLSTLKDQESKAMAIFDLKTQHKTTLTWPFLYH